ncbi:MAG: serine hydrolase domain-containing protein, partial [Bryobacteraceae bacterium]
MNQPSRRIPTYCVAACMLAAFVARAQELPVASPESVGLSSQRLERIAAAVQQSIADKKIAGAVTLVARRGSVVWLKAQGMADREAAKPMQTDAIFRICSMTKPLTSLAVMMLYEDGRFLLDDPVSRYIPEFKNPKVLVKAANGQTYTIPATREITIRNLLTHTSGLTYHWNPDVGQLYKDANVAHGLLPYDGAIGDSVKRLAGL